MVMTCLNTENSTNFKLVSMLTGCLTVQAFVSARETVIAPKLWGEFPFLWVAFTQTDATTYQSHEAQVMFKCCVRIGSVLVGRTGD